MHRAKANFDNSFVRIRRIDTIYLHWVNIVRLTHNDVEDLLRSEVVYAVSALDRLVHDLVKIGMVDIYEGRRPATPAYNSYDLTISQHQNINSGTLGIPGSAVFQSIIEKNHSRETYQSPDNIKDALSLIWILPHKWQSIANRMGRSEQDVKTELNNIVIRRNQIVHEMDLDLSTGIVQPITHASTQQIVNFVEEVGNNIYAFL